MNNIEKYFLVVCLSSKISLIRNVKIEFLFFFRTTDETLKDYLKKYGEITDCLVMKDHSGQSKCFGFVTFINSNIVDEFMKQRPHVIDDRQIDPKRASTKR